MITTARLVLRDWRDSDRLPLNVMNNDPEVMAHLGPPQSLSETDDLIARLQQFTREMGHSFWALERSDTGEFLGFCGLKRCEHGPPAGNLEIGWRLKRDAWGQGYAREAATATLEWAAERDPGQAVMALTVVGNERSWGLMERLGMHRRTDLDYILPDPDGRHEARLRNIIVYSTHPA